MSWRSTVHYCQLRGACGKSNRLLDFCNSKDNCMLYNAVKNTWSA